MFENRLSARLPGCAVVLKAAALLAVATALSGCYQTREAADATPTDYRQRHPISIVEGERSMTVFVGTQRGGLAPAQRAEVLAFSRSWRKDGTGSVIIDVPEGTPSQRAVTDTSREIISMLKAAEIPPAAIRMRQYRSDRIGAAAIRISYPRIAAEAGPCGLWPKDLGPGGNSNWTENRPYWNHGCATQHNLAAMVDNPADIVQPRASEASAYAPRRSVVLEHYRRGESTATNYPNPNQGKISDIGQ